MTIHLGNIPASTVLYIPFATYDGATGASETCSGLAVTDIEIYKNGSTTQRSSDAGYTLLDTDGIDFDGITGINGFSIDLADNTDAGFYAAGSTYWVIVSSITADAVTVNFIAATFRIVAAEAITGKPKVDVDGWLGTACATPTVAGVPEVDLTHVAGATTNVSALATNVDAILTDTAEIGAAGAGLTALATQASVNTIDDFLDTEVAAILAAVDTEVAAIKTKTDFLPSATAGAAGGLFIAGTNAPVTITGSGTALTLLSTGGNGHGVSLTSHGTGSGVNALGGTSGYGAVLTGGTAGGEGLRCESQAGNSDGAHFGGIGTGQGIHAAGGADGAGMYLEGGATSGDGLLLDGNGSGVDLDAVTTTLPFATQTSVDTIDDFLDTEIAAIISELAKVPKSDSTVTWNATALASINAEVLDVLNVDTFAQPGQSTPAATTSIRLMLAWLYKAWRNKNTQTATTYSLMNDDTTTVDQKATTADDGTTYSRTEIETGP